MRGLPQRLQAWAERRLPALTRYRQPEPLPIELHRRRIYIVPTGFGIGFAMLLLVMLVGALNYANNAALLLTCLLGAASATSMLVAFIHRRPLLREPQRHLGQPQLPYRRNARRRLLPWLWPFWKRWCGLACCMAGQA